MTKLPGGVQPRTLWRVLPFLLAPVLIGLSMLVQRPLARWLGVPGPVWPLVPLAPSVRWSHRLSIRGAGLLFTFLLVLGGISLQTRREQRLVPRVTVAEGTAAAEAGLQTNDLITAVEGVAVDDFNVLREELLQGSQAKRLTLVRDGVVLERTVTLRAGVLGVKASGEQREASGAEAVQRAARMLVTLPVVYARLIGRALAAGAKPAISTAVSPSGPRQGPPVWLLALTLSLAFSWWLTLVVEVCALGAGVLLQRRAVLRAGS